MLNLTIIGGGFAGTMLAINCIRKSSVPLRISIIDENGLFARGIAYSPYSGKQLLNVVAGKMSAFSSEPSHFLDWLLNQKDFQNIDKNLLSQAFIPRRIYGDYIEQLWTAVLKDLPPHVSVVQYRNKVSSLSIAETGVKVVLDNEERIEADHCVLATGNSLPKNPGIRNSDFFSSPQYFRNPWSKESVEDLRHDKPVLIIGNGLTMVDTVIGLLENGFHGKIFSISPNGFNILPHRHSSIQYQGLLKDLPQKPTLDIVARLVFKHVRIVRSFGVTAEPVIDSLRPLTQSLWKEFTTAEKKKFLSRFRHLWGVARHRLPLHVYDRIQKLKRDQELNVISGSLKDIESHPEGFKVTYFNKRTKAIESILVQRVINCTGPDSDIKNIPFLDNLAGNGIIVQDELKLGVNTDPSTFQTIAADGKRNQRIYAIGSLLRGTLWESTAVNELRTQTEILSTLITK